jgi:hypothetical protein
MHMSRANDWEIETGKLPLDETGTGRKILQLQKTKPRRRRLKSKDST